MAEIVEKHNAANG